MDWVTGIWKFVWDIWPKLFAIGAPIGVIPFAKRYVEKWSDLGFAKKLSAFETQQGGRLAAYKSELDSRSQQQLATLNHDFNSKLEAVRLSNNLDLARVNNLLESRISKIHEKEFEVLPEAWLLINKAYGSVSRLIGLKTIPEVANMPDEIFEELIARYFNTFTAVQVAKIKKVSGGQRQAEFTKAFEYKDADEARNDLRELQNYVIKHSLFIEPPIDSLFDSMRIDLQEIYYAYESRLDGHRDGEELKRMVSLLGGMKAKLADLRIKIRDRLRQSDFKPTKTFPPG